MNALSRKPGWRARIDATIDQYRRARFGYGDFDCAVFAAAGIEALTGERVGKAAWWKYRSARGGASVIKKAGFVDLADMAASLLPEIHPSQAYVGDIAAIPSDGPFGWSLGVVGGERIFVLRETGLATVDLLTATRAFKVG
ncbi:MAG TPA: hypothetical protein VFT69_17175 [Pseudolabrys sp.]|nr:hypothetical protein [Pseudolabrys sp.]